MLTETDPSHLLREPVRGGVVYPGLAALPGVEQVRALLAGRARTAGGPADGPPDRRRVGRLGDICASGDGLDAGSEG